MARRVTTTPSSLIIFGRKFDNVMLKPRRCPCTASMSPVDEERKEHHNDNKNNKNRAYTPKKVWTPPLEVSKTLNRMPTILEWRGPNFPQDQSSGLVFLVDKPQEWTSFDVCAKIKSMSKKMGVKKIDIAARSIRWRLVCYWSSSVERQSWQTSTRQK